MNSPHCQVKDWKEKKKSLIKKKEEGSLNHYLPRLDGLQSVPVDMFDVYNKVSAVICVCSKTRSGILVLKGKLIFSNLHLW